ncbi:C13 family peptidase [Nitrosomonas sp.]|uniref:C13 family peptidase n=1 Tax=Nitrosomonas sp. TaxID=42353 RepID=UPI0025E14FD5|nr:C13 family peptidase [Nitrosomonas sp.]
MDLYASIPKELKQSGAVKELRVLFRNLYCGLKLLAFRRNIISQITASYDQFILLLGFYGITTFIASYVITPNPVFGLFGLGYIGVELLGVLLVGFVLAKLCEPQDQLLQFLTATYCVLPFFYLFSITVIPFLPDAYFDAGYMVYTLWILSVSFYVVLQLLNWQKIKAIMVVMLWVCASYPLTNVSLSFWHEDFDYSEALAAYNDDDLSFVNQEQVYYNQYQLLNNALNVIESGVEGITDLFFIGFGADSSQDVFMKEINNVQNIMNLNLGAAGRSVALINNLKTIDTTPLASSTNLRIALNHIGSKINPEEDIVLLYLTSHGSFDHELSVNMWPLELNDIGPDDIRAYLDDAGIQWRIILVSACYSGAFIDALKNETSLIMTAAASDRASFGCSSENEFTYFGEALFKNVEGKSYQFIDGFNQAIERIKQREISENLIPSNSQLFVGNLMREKLELLEHDMARYAPERFGSF